MPKINVTPKQFPNIVVSYIYHKMLHPDSVSAGKRLFDELIENMKKKGMVPTIRDYYLNPDFAVDAVGRRIKP